jgi:hypothetical protein
MSRKDYELIARAIYGSLIQSGSLESQDKYADQHRLTARHVANALERTNPRFDRDRFIEACGVLTNTEVKL